MASERDRSHEQEAEASEEIQREEKWKMSPSTEVTGEGGENAKLAEARQQEENAPRNREPKRTGAPER